MDSLDEDLAAYYDREAADRADRTLDPERVTRRDEFVALLLAEERHTVLEVGTGPGRDAAGFLAAGLQVTGVDLAAENVRLARQVGVEAHQTSVHAMPFPPRAFDAGWTMSTLVHVPDDQFDAALDAIAARLVHGAPLAVGLWGGHDHEGWKANDAEPRRFFSRRSHDRLRAMLGRVGRLERFDTWQHRGPTGWEYQWAVVRVAHDEPPS